MKTLLCIWLLIAFTGCATKDNKQIQSLGPDSVYTDKHRPQLHFSPQANWLNDPNGMVFHNGEYHLFYQYYPNDIKPGPRHWGHAVSTDLVHWTHLPIALYPDSLGQIFSGSAVVDKNNTSGFGDNEHVPLVAIFTYHSDEKEKAGATDFENQGIAYSIDDGRIWIKFKGNPVLKNQGIRDFRDPKVFWHEQSGKWIMILAVKDHIELWSSGNLKEWNKLSDFGRDYGSHAGVWECPDLFELPVQNENASKWIMLVSINPGGPNRGSATQYFIGDFDGKNFKAEVGKKDTAWIDYGPDDYAGVTWSNAPDNRKIFIGWMSNWDYADDVPTQKWRSATTVPRDLHLIKTPKGYKIASVVSQEFLKSAAPAYEFKNVAIKDSLSLNSAKAPDLSKSLISGTVDANDFTIVFSNARNQQVVIGYDSKQKKYFIDRSLSGTVDFSPGFRGRIYAERMVESDKIDFTIVSDDASLEVFFDHGTSVMTTIFFPDEPLGRIVLKVQSDFKVERIQTSTMKSIWK